MDHSHEQSAGWKQKLVHELKVYWINFAYLAVFFGAFTWYRRLILAEYRISYVNYGVALIEALVLAKVVLIGDAFHLGKRVESGPLIAPTLYKTIVFTIWVAIFKVLEHLISGLVRGEGLAGGIRGLRSEGADAFFAHCLIMFSAFIPYFAFRELSRVLGKGRIWQLFIHGEGESHSEPNQGATPERAAGWSLRFSPRR